MLFPLRVGSLWKLGLLFRPLFLLRSLAGWVSFPLSFLNWGNIGFPFLLWFSLPDRRSGLLPSFPPALPPKLRKNGNFSLAVWPPPPFRRGEFFFLPKRVVGPLLRGKGNPICQELMEFSSFSLHNHNDTSPPSLGGNLERTVFSPLTPFQFIPLRPLVLVSENALFSFSPLILNTSSSPPPGSLSHDCLRLELWPSSLSPLPLGGSEKLFPPLGKGNSTPARLRIPPFFPPPLGPTFREQNRVGQ